MKPSRFLLCLSLAAIAAAAPVLAQKTVRVDNATGAVTEPSNLWTANSAAIASAVSLSTYQPLDGDLTAYAGAVDAAARRLLISAASTADLASLSGSFDNFSGDPSSAPGFDAGTWRAELGYSTAAVGDASGLTTGTLAAARLPAFTGDATSSAGSSALTLSTVATPGTYRSVTVDAKGRVTAGTNPTTVATSGLTDAVASALTISTTAPLAGGGDLSSNRTLTVATANSTIAGVVPGLGGTSASNAATVGQIKFPAVSELTPYFQRIWRSDTAARGIALGDIYMPASPITIASGTMILVPFSGVSGLTVASVGLGVSSSGASGLTLARVGIYEVSSWMLSQGPSFFSAASSALVASSASFTTLNANNAITVSLSTPLVLDPAKLYYVGLLQVGTTPAQLRGSPVGNGFFRVAHPHACLGMSGLSDLPSDLTTATTSGSGFPLIHTFLSP